MSHRRQSMTPEFLKKTLTSQGPTFNPLSYSSSQRSSCKTQQSALPKLFIPDFQNRKNQFEKFSKIRNLSVDRVALSKIDANFLARTLRAEKNIESPFLKSLSRSPIFSKKSKIFTKAFLDSSFKIENKPNFTRKTIDTSANLKKIDCQNRETNTINNGIVHHEKEELNEKKRLLKPKCKIARERGQFCPEKDRFSDPKKFLKNFCLEARRKKANQFKTLQNNVKRGFPPEQNHFGAMAEKRVRPSPQVPFFSMESNVEMEMNDLKEWLKFKTASLRQNLKEETMRDASLNLRHFQTSLRNNF